jgi:hypothetical protein
MPRLNLLIDTTRAPLRVGDVHEPRVERIACSWRGSTGFLAHTWARGGQTVRRQLVLTQQDVQRLERLVRATQLGARSADGVVCRLVIVDASGQSQKGHADPAKAWIEWSASMRARSGDEWREVRVRPEETLDATAETPAASLWSRLVPFRLLGRKADS